MGKEVKTWLNDSEITGTSDPLWLEQESKQAMEGRLERDLHTESKDILSPEELSCINESKTESELAKVASENKQLKKVIKKITSAASHLIQKLMICWKIRVLDRVQEFFKIKYRAFNFNSRFEYI